MGSAFTYAAVEPVAMTEAPSPRWGSATWIALIVPIRLVSITSVQACSGGSPFIGAIPACATTMSSRPNSAIPCSSAALSCPRSRTSACTATMRRSSASTRRTVSFRSPGPASEYFTVSMSWHRSTAMMSAPSCASRTA